MALPANYKAIAAASPAPAAGSRELSSFCTVLVSHLSCFCVFVSIIMHSNIQLPVLAVYSIQGRDNNII